MLYHDYNMHSMHSIQSRCPERQPDQTWLKSMQNTLPILACNGLFVVLFCIGSIPRAEPTGLAQETCSAVQCSRLDLEICSWLCEAQSFKTAATRSALGSSAVSILCSCSTTLRTQHPAIRRFHSIIAQQDDSNRQRACRDRGNLYLL